MHPRSQREPVPLSIHHLPIAVSLALFKARSVPFLYTLVATQAEILSDMARVTSSSVSNRRHEATSNGNRLQCNVPLSLAEPHPYCFTDSAFTARTQ